MRGKRKREGSLESELKAECKSHLILLFPMFFVPSRQRRQLLDLCPGAGSVRRHRPVLGEVKPAGLQLGFPRFWCRSPFLSEI